jgi:hypothetical protein
MRHPAGEAKSVGIGIRVSTEDEVRGEGPDYDEERTRQTPDFLRRLAVKRASSDMPAPTVRASY